MALEFYCITSDHIHGAPTRANARLMARYAALPWGHYAVIVANEYDSEADAEAIADARRAIQARKLFDAACERIESASIRAWARASNQRWLFCKWLRTCIMSGRAPDVHMVCAFVVSSAIGL